MPRPLVRQPGPPSAIESGPIAAALLAVLHERGVLPVGGDAPWKRFTIDHSQEGAVFRRSAFKQHLPPELQSLCGVYVYRDGNAVLYVGKGKPVSERMSWHCHWSFNEPKKKKEDSGHARFWRLCRKKVEVYVLTLGQRARAVRSGGAPSGLPSTPVRPGGRLAHVTRDGRRRYSCPC